MALSDPQLLDSLSRMPFVDSAELALVLGEPHATVHRALTGLLADGIVGRVKHAAPHLPSSQRYFVTANDIRETAGLLGFDTPSDFVRAYPVSREWLTLLTRRMDAVAAVYRLVASLSPGIDGLRSHVEFHRRGRFDATITIHDGRSFGVVSLQIAVVAQCPGQLPPPQTQREHSPQPAQPPCFRQCHCQRLLPPPQMVFPAR